MKEGKERRGFDVDLSVRITAETVQRMGEMMAICAFKPFLRHSDQVFSKLYRGLIRDIHCAKNPGHSFSDGYDFAQEAICFLCGHMGKTLDDVLGVDRRGKILTVRLACLRTVVRAMNKLLTNKRRNAYVDTFHKFKIPELKLELSDDLTEEDYTNVNKIIKILELTDSQKKYLQCMMDTKSYSEAGRILSIDKATIWRTIMRIREKYIRIFSAPKFRQPRV